MFFLSTLHILPYIGLDIPTLEKMLSDGIRLETPVYAPSHISDHMLKCWNENPDKRPCYSSFLHNIENLYGLKTSSDLKATSKNTNGSRVKSIYLNYASLAFHEDSVENRYKKLRNLR